MRQFIIATLFAAIAIGAAAPASAYVTRGPACVTIHADSSAEEYERFDKFLSSAVFVKPYLKVDVYDAGWQEDGSWAYTPKVGDVACHAGELKLAKPANLPKHRCYAMPEDGLKAMLLTAYVMGGQQMVETIRHDGLFKDRMHGLRFGEGSKACTNGAYKAVYVDQEGKPFQIVFSGNYKEH